MGILGLSIVVIAVILIILTLLVNKDIEKNVKIYENGLRIRYECKGIKESYNIYYHKSKEFNDVLKKEDVIKLFKDLNVPVKSFEEKYIIIPWEAVVSWKYDRTMKMNFLSGRGYGRDIIIFNIEKFPSQLVVDKINDLEFRNVLHMAFKKYAKCKEGDSYKTPISL